MKSGRDYDKFSGIEFKEDLNGNPYIEKDTIAYMSLNVSSVLDLDSHYLFVCDVVEGKNTGEGKPMTYADYRALKSGKAITKTDTKEKSKEKSYVCTVCHYVYDGDIPFDELPNDWVCPVCKQSKSVFLAEG